MSDSWRVTSNLWGVPSPGPTSLELASYCIAEEGIDFDSGALFRTTYVENPARDGGQRAYSQSGVRKFRFPLRLASSWPGPGGLHGLEDYLRRLVRAPNPGYIDLLPEGAEVGGNPSAAIRFDIIDGRVNWRQYDVYRQRIARRDVDLELDVQPYGYLPTTITLASAGAASVPFQLAINQASIIGDVPGLAEIVIRATRGTASALVASTIQQWGMDAVWWSLSRASGATALFSPSLFWLATSGNILPSPPLLAATFYADTAAPLGAVMRVAISPTVGQWQHVTLTTIFDAGMAPYRGRFRLLTYMRTGQPSYGVPWQITADEVPIGVGGGDGAFARLASSYPVATLLPGQIPSGGGGFSATYTEAASGMFQVLDLGEHTWPPLGSGFGGGEGFSIRLWAKPGTTNVGVPSPHIEFGGLWALPLDTMFGLLPRGLVYPTYYNVIATEGGLVAQGNQGVNQLCFDSIKRARLSGQAFGALAPFTGLVADMRSNYFGPDPEIATSLSLDVGVAGRLILQLATSQTGGGQMMHAHPYAVSASVRYRPRFAFLRGL